MAELTTKQESADQESDLDTDTVFTILKNPRRRYVIRCLRELGGESTVRELTAEVAARENDCPAADLEYDQRKTVYTSLYQTHLETMDEAGVVDYDQRSGEVRLADAVEAMEPHIAVANGDQVGEVDEGAYDDRNWDRLYLAVAVANLVLVGGWLIGGSLLAGASPATPIAVATGTTALLLAVLAGYRWLRYRGRDSVAEVARLD